MKVLEMLGIYGWKTETENLLLASLLTGDPVLLVGRHGCAKTHVACKLAEALQKNFVAYDASKTLFDDVLGYPDIEKMKQGKIEYLPSKVTVWDKEIMPADGTPWYGLRLYYALTGLPEVWGEPDSQGVALGYHIAPFQGFAHRNIRTRTGRNNPRITAFPMPGGGPLPQQGHGSRVSGRDIVLAATYSPALSGKMP